MANLLLMDTCGAFNDKGVQMKSVVMSGPAERRYSLMCYTREVGTAEEANNADVALSMHLAIRSHESARWVPLNDNYGIYFAAGIPKPGINDSARRACTKAPRYGTQESIEGVGGDTALSEAVGYNAVMPGKDIVLKSLRDPYIFRDRSGGFIIVSTRIARGGSYDGSERSSMLICRSADLLSYESCGQLHVESADGVHRPRGIYDERAQLYRFAWDDDMGVTHSTVVDDLDAIADRSFALEDPSKGASIPIMKTGTEERPQHMSDIPDAVVGNVIAISAGEAEILLDRFGRIYNTGAEVAAIDVPVEELRNDEGAFRHVLESLKATLTYSDGSSAQRSVTWDESGVQSALRRISGGKASQGDVIDIPGTVVQQVYPVPFAQRRADPSVFSWSWNGKAMFMFIATDDTDGNCIDPHNGRTHMPLRVAESISRLSDEEGGRDSEIDLLKCGDRNSEGRMMTGCFWAPELHVIAGRLSILFMPCFDDEGAGTSDGSEQSVLRRRKPDMWTGRCHIMQLKKDEHSGEDLDPRDPGNWSIPEPITRSDGGILNPIQLISLDMSVIQDSGRWYYIWQQVGSIWIAQFDPEHPARLTTDPTQIVVPEFAWDNLIAEGPNAIVHDGFIYMLYSGSSVGIDYTTGLVIAPAGVGADLQQAETWRKQDYPLQKSGLYNGEWQLGTGHGMWSKDEHGVGVYVFHNACYASGRYDGRDAQIRRVHWRASGIPLLDMQTKEELDPRFASVTATIRIC